MVATGISTGAFWDEAGFQPSLQAGSVSWRCRLAAEVCKEENLLRRVGTQQGFLPKPQLRMEMLTKAPGSSASRQQAVKARKRLFLFQNPLWAQPLCCVKFTALIVPSCTLMRH